MAIRSKISYFPSPKGNAKGPQQLALFNMKPDNPWPLGYTPERKREIEAAMPPVTIGVDSGDMHAHGKGWAGDWDSTFEKVSSRVSRAVPLSESLSDDVNIRKQMREKGTQRRETVYNRAEKAQSTRARNTIARSLARSKVSPDALKGVSSIDVSTDSPYAGASYNFVTGEMYLTHNADTPEMLLLHELGHANDPKIQTSPKSTILDGGVRIGARVEGFAEGYGQANYVPRNINPKQFVRDYDHEYVPSEHRFLRNIPEYQEGILEGSGGEVSIAKEDEKVDNRINTYIKNLDRKEQFKQLSLDEI